MAWRGLIVLAAALGSGCGDSVSAYRNVIRDQTKAFEELEQILSTVTDQASMKAAGAEVGKRWKRCEAIKDRALELPSPTSAVREQVYEESIKLKQVLDNVRWHMGRIRALPGGEDFVGSFDQGQGFLGGAP
jgi:hypothetical protein